MLQKMYLTASQALVYRSVNVAKLSAKIEKTDDNGAQSLLKAAH